MAKLTQPYHCKTVYLEYLTCLADPSKEAGLAARAEAITTPAATRAAGAACTDDHCQSPNLAKVCSLDNLWP